MEALAAAGWRCVRRCDRSWRMVIEVGVRKVVVIWQPATFSSLSALAQACKRPHRCRSSGRYALSKWGNR